MPDRAENDFAIMRCRARVVPLRNVNKKFKRVISGSAQRFQDRLLLLGGQNQRSPGDGTGPSQRRLSQRMP